MDDVDAEEAIYTSTSTVACPAVCSNSEAVAVQADALSGGELEHLRRTYTQRMHEEDSHY